MKKMKFLPLKIDRKRFHIGTDEPESLVRAIETIKAKST